MYMCIYIYKYICVYILQLSTWPGWEKTQIGCLRDSTTQKNLFEILLTEIRLYLPFSDWLGTKWTSVWFQINRKMVNRIWFRFDLTESEVNSSACRKSWDLKMRHKLQKFVNKESNCVETVKKCINRKKKRV